MIMIGNGEMRLGQTKEYMFVCFMLLFGIAAFSAILGSASALMASLDSASIERQNEISSIEQFLSFRRIPTALRARITAYFNYQWDTGTTPYHKSLFLRLPAELSLELKLSLKRRLIEQTPLFVKCTPGTILALVRRLTSGSATPGEMVIHEGGVGDCMYFVTTGKLRVLHSVGGGGRSDNGQRGAGVELVELHSGSYFGELALLGERIRSASVQALTFCELERLSYDDFDELLQAHDDLLAQVIKSAKVRIARLRQSFKAKHVEPAAGGWLFGGGDSSDGAPKNFWQEAAKAVLDKSNVFNAVVNAANRVQPGVASSKNPTAR
jgi:CRP-like cAMP-binding protein